MSFKKILIVSGTHGNEINPIWAINQFNKEENRIDEGIQYTYAIGNPLASERGCRYVDVDLNRSFNSVNQNNDDKSRNYYEIKRANYLIKNFGENGSDPCGMAIDLHTTTANMGTSIVIYGRRRKDLCLAALIQNKYGLPIYLHENDKEQTGFLVEAWPCGLVIEIGAVAQNFYDPEIIKRFLIIISSLRQEINKLKNNLIKLPDQLIAYVHQGSIDYPKGKNKNINAIIHPRRINQDWKRIKKGDPLFLDMEGNTLRYEGEEIIYPVFIGEVAYKEKNIAMSFTKKEVIFLSNEWAEEFFN